MKAIMMSISPEWVAKILNGEKTIEIRKRFPKNYVGWVYIYCTKDRRKYLGFDVGGYYSTYKHTDLPIEERKTYSGFNGKVVARFWCDKVEEIINNGSSFHCGDVANTNIKAKQSCLDFKDMHYYLKDKNGYAIHISQLEIFDKPKELSEFKMRGKVKCKCCVKYILCKQVNAECANGYCNIDNGYCDVIYPITNAPQNYYYIEVEDDN